MSLPKSGEAASRFSAYVEGLTSAIGHADRARPLRDYCVGLMLVDTAKMRWRIERDYQELKQEVGLGHFEGRGWRGFHHHATLCIAAYGFLISERETIPPSGTRSPRLFTEITIPETYRPRGSAIAA